jgi:hypothetical protein
VELLSLLAGRVQPALPHATNTAAVVAQNRLEMATLSPLFSLLPLAESPDTTLVRWGDAGRGAHSALPVAWISPAPGSGALDAGEQSATTCTSEWEIGGQPASDCVVGWARRGS